MCRLRLRLRLRWSSPYTYERFYDFIVKSLRLRFLPGIRFSKMTNVKTWLLTDLAVSLIATLNECFFNLSLIVIQGHWRTLHWRGHRLLRVALSEISGLGPKWSFATDTQRILKIRRRISPRWRFWSVAWLNLIKDFLGVQIIKIHVFGSEENFQECNVLVLK